MSDRIAKSAANSLSTAVLFLVFNRLDTTKQVFEAIRKAKPQRLYVAADGARENRQDEEKKIQAVRSFVIENIDWHCEVKTLFRDKNLGCKHAVSSAITWFFENEEQGIILEDDVVPHQDFFYFVESMLLKYQHDKRVMMITGTNYLGDPMLKEPYFFSEHMTIWGWGSWRRAWGKYDVDMCLWDESSAKSYFRKKYFESFIWKHFRNTFDSLKNNYMDTWDIQWVFTCLINHGLCIVPKVNLISNIGVEGTHSSEIGDSHFIKLEPLSCNEYENYNPLVHVNYEYDLLLHSKKSRPAVIRGSIVKLLKMVRIYGLLRKIKRYFKK